MNNISTGTVEHIINLGKARENSGLSDEASIDLFDSIDCLDADELAELYALIEIGGAGEFDSFAMLVTKAKDIGFPLADIIYENNKLGSILSKGYALFYANS